MSQHRDKKPGALLKRLPQGQGWGRLGRGRVFPGHRSTGAVGAAFPQPAAPGLGRSSPAGLTLGRTPLPPPPCLSPALALLEAH